MTGGDKDETTASSGYTSRIGEVADRKPKIVEDGNMEEVAPSPPTTEEGLAYFNAFKEEMDAHIAKYTTTAEDKREWAAIQKMNIDEVLVTLKNLDKSLLKLAKDLRDQEKDLKRDLD